MIKYFYTLLIVLIFVGCTSLKKDVQLSEYEKNTTTKIYENISKDAIFEAAKKVFILLGKDEFRIDSYRDNLQVSKTKLSHFPFYAYTTNDIWNISIEEKENRSIVKVNVKRIKDFDEKNGDFLSKDLHRFLLDRIDYLLGLNDNWRSCLFAFSLSDALCDGVDLNTLSSPSKDDMVKNILISQRKSSKSLSEIEDDILEKDVVFTLDDSNDDILEKSDEITDKSEDDGISEDELEKRIQELDDIVNTNIDKTLDRIKTEDE